MTPCVIRQHRTDFARGACSPALALLRRSPARGCGVVAAGAPASPPRLQPQPPGGKKEDPGPCLALVGFKNRWVVGEVLCFKKKGSLAEDDGEGEGSGLLQFLRPPEKRLGCVCRGDACPCHLPPAGGVTWGFHPVAVPPGSFPAHPWCAWQRGGPSILPPPAHPPVAPRSLGLCPTLCQPRSCLFGPLGTSTGWSGGNREMLRPLCLFLVSPFFIFPLSLVSVVLPQLYIRQVSAVSVCLGHPAQTSHSSKRHSLSRSHLPLHPSLRFPRELQS